MDISTALRAYVDTCVVSALVKNDIDVAELRALTEIFVRYTRGDLDLCCSPVVDEEITKIPADYRGPHLALLKEFATVPKVTVGGVTRLGPGGFGVANPHYRLWRALRAALPDEPDAWHVFVAARNRIRYLITVDQRTMLSRRSEVLRASGVELMLPSSFIAVSIKQGR